MFKWRWFQTSAAREAVVLDNYDTAVDLELQALFIGDGTTLGGVAISSMLTPAQSMARGIPLTLAGYTVGGLPGPDLQAQINAALDAGWVEPYITYLDFGPGPVVNGNGQLAALSLGATSLLTLGTLVGNLVGVNGNLSSLTLPAAATLYLGTLAGIGNTSLGALSLPAGTTLSLGELVALAPGSVSLGGLSLPASATLGIGTLTGRQIATLGALSLTGASTLSVGTLAGIAGAVSGTLGSLALSASATLALGTVNGQQIVSLGNLSLTASSSLALGTLAVGVVNGNTGNLSLTASTTLALGTLAAAGGITYQDLSTYTKVDNTTGSVAVSSITSTTATVLKGSTLSTIFPRGSQQVYLYKDFGAGHFGDFVIDFTYILPTPNGVGSAEIGTIMLSNGIGDLYWQENNSSDYIGSFAYTDSASTAQPGVETSSTNYSQLSTTGLATNVTRYCTLSRTGTTITLKTYADSGRTSLTDTRTLTGTSTTYRYLYVLASYADSAAGNSNLTISNVYIH